MQARSASISSIASHVSRRRARGARAHSCIRSTPKALSPAQRWQMALARKGRTTQTRVAVKRVVTAFCEAAEKQERCRRLNLPNPARNKLLAGFPIMGMAFARVLYGPSRRSQTASSASQTPGAPQTGAQRFCAVCAIGTEVAVRRSRDCRLLACIEKRVEYVGISDPTLPEGGGFTLPEGRQAGHANAPAGLGAPTGPDRPIAKKTRRRRALRNHKQHASMREADPTRDRGMCWVDGSNFYSLEPSGIDGSSSVRAARIHRPQSGQTHARAREREPPRERPTLSRV